MNNMNIEESELNGYHYGHYEEEKFALPPLGIWQTLKDNVFGALSALRVRVTAFLEDRIIGPVSNYVVDHDVRETELAVASAAARIAVVLALVGTLALLRLVTRLGFLTSQPVVLAVALGASVLVNYVLVLVVQRAEVLRFELDEDEALHDEALSESLNG